MRLMCQPISAAQRSFSRYRGLALILALIFAAQSLPAPAYANSKYAALVIHADTGDVLFSKYATGRRYPASLTKMMTLYLLFEEMDAGRLSAGSKLKTSKRAAGQPPSKIGLKSREHITVDQAIRALVVKSANDVAVVVAEHISGSEIRFAHKMTRKARMLGMHATRFRNASGLPNRRQVSTARDLAVLSQRVIQDFPQYFHYFQVKTFTYKGKTQKSHNKLVGRYDGADGLKTGYTRLSGYNLSTTAIRGQHRLIGIVLGGRTPHTRNAHMEKILNGAFAKISRKPSMLKASFRTRPLPRLKDQTLDFVGGVWPPRNTPQHLSAAIPETSGSGGSDGSVRMGIPDAVRGLIDDAPKEADELNLKSLERALASARPPQTNITIGEGDYAPLIPTTPYGIQIGAYEKLEAAQKHAAAARMKIIDSAPNLMEDITEVKKQTKTLYRVRFLNMNASEARQACIVLVEAGGECFSLKERVRAE